MRNREDAKFEFLIDLDEPTAGIVSDAASAGFYDSPTKKYPRVQIQTIEGITV